MILYNSQRTRQDDGTDRGEHVVADQTSSSCDEHVRDESHSAVPDSVIQDAVMRVIRRTTEVNRHIDNIISEIDGARVIVSAANRQYYISLLVDLLTNDTLKIPHNVIAEMFACTLVRFIELKNVNRTNAKDATTDENRVCHQHS